MLSVQHRAIGVRPSSETGGQRDRRSAGRGDRFRRRKESGGSADCSPEPDRVPEDSPSILAAVDLAVAGDSILVGPGTWTDRDQRVVVFCGTALLQTSCGFLKPGITLIGVEGPEQTVIDGGMTGTGITTLLHLESGTEPVRVEGFTITGGGDGLGVCSSSRIEFERCWIVNNADGGVVMSESDVAFYDCILEGNDADRHGFAAIHSTYADLELRGCRFWNNGAWGIWLDTAPAVTIDDCEFVNHSEYSAALLVNVNDLLVRDSAFIRDVRALGLANCVGTIEFCVFAYDSARSSSGGAVSVVTSNVDFEHNTFFACYALIHGAAVTISGGTSRFAGNIVSKCVGLSALHKSGGPMDPTSGCNVLFGNDIEDFAGDWEGADTDVFADPEFCDPEALDFTVSKGSPCAEGNTPACGQIGALGVGCASVSIESESWGRIKGLYRSDVTR